MNLDKFTHFAKTSAADKWCALYDSLCTDGGFFIKDPRDFLTSAKTLLQHNFDCATQMDIVQRVQDYVSRCWTHAQSSTGFQVLHVYYKLEQSRFENTITPIGCYSVGARFSVGTA